jgi:hypothetical protein
MSIEGYFLEKLRDFNASKHILARGHKHLSVAITSVWEGEDVNFP